MYDLSLLFSLNLKSNLKILLLILRGITINTIIIKMLIIVDLLITLGNLKQSIYLKILFSKIVDIYIKNSIAVY